MKKIVRRTASSETIAALTAQGNVLPLLGQLYALRGITMGSEIDYSLQRLLPFQQLKDIEQAADCLETALREQQRVVVVGDFDVDGATSTALAVAALRSFGLENISYIVPNRFEFGYGLTPEIVHLALQKKPDLLITVDNGIASCAGVAAANSLGMRVLITDHHLPGQELPAAAAIVNPTQLGDQFPSKNLAGVGVIFYVMCALRSKLRATGWFKERGIAEPNMAQFLDLVALGTVADVVPLDHNNRILVHQGLERIRAGNCCMGIKVLLSVASRNYTRVTAGDLAFAIAPRLNAAGRLDEMSLGVECLLNDSVQNIRAMAKQLDALNQERREIESGMHKQALDILDNMQFAERDLPLGVCMFDASWHQGVIGILAGRIKDKLQRPTIAFAAVSEDEIKGSARSIAGLHLRNVLENIATQQPDLITRFGGHAMAAGLTIPRAKYALFSEIFATEVARQLSTEDLEQKIYSDGELPVEYLTLEVAELLHRAGPWGHGFPEPTFDGIFKVVDKRIVGQKHLKLTLQKPDVTGEFNAIAFNVDPAVITNLEYGARHLVYKLAVNEYNGRRSLQLMVEDF